MQINKLRLALSLWHLSLLNSDQPERCHEGEANSSFYQSAGIWLINRISGTDLLIR